MAISELDLFQSIYWLLGLLPHDPRAAEIADRLNLRKCPNIEAVRSGILMSPEFQSAVQDRLYHVPNEDLQVDTPRLVFLHLPKCAGTSLHSVLCEHFAARHVCPERFNGLRRYSLGELARYRLFSGHFDLQSCRAVPGRRNRIITMLREPVARLVSLYYFLSIHSSEADEVPSGLASLARAMPIADFFRHPLVATHPSVWNATTTALTGAVAETRWEALSSAPDGGGVEDRRQSAFDSLASLDGFGLLERYELSLELLSRVTGLALTASAPLQVTDTLRHLPQLRYAERPVVTAEVFAILQALTEQDRELYRRAEALFEDRVQAMRAAAPTTRTIRADDYDHIAEVPLDRMSPLEARYEAGRLVASGRGGIVATGPYSRLGPGRYVLQCFLLRRSGSEGSTIRVSVWHNRGRGKLTDVDTMGAGPILLPFELHYDVDEIEFVLTLESGDEVELLAMKLLSASAT